MPESEKLRELERRNRELEMELAFLKKQQRTCVLNGSQRLLAVGAM